MEQKEQPATQRLVFNERSGWYPSGRIPYKVHLDFDMPDTEDLLILNKKTPGKHVLTPDLNFGGYTSYSVSIFIHESVPKEFEDIVAFHELREAELIYADEIESAQAHQQAVAETDEYARRNLSEENYKRFIEWQKDLDFE